MSFLNTQHCEIFDVTLRDGSYEVGFQFSRKDQTEVGKALGKANVKYVEIGHGQGLNASNEINGVALCTDEEYLEEAGQNLEGINFGTFFIPGIGRISDLDLLAKYGASFVRIGCNTTIQSVKESQKYISRAKELGLEVFSNYMKTYAATLEEYGECVRLSLEAGSNVAVIVDSAGCMLPEDISNYYDITRDIAGETMKVGFHGHDNLGMAIANSLHALELGCEYIDTSLQCLGRGAGNASTEQMIAILSKRYGDTRYGLAPLMAFSEEYIRPRVKFKGVSGLDTYCGIAGFHSGYMNSIRKVAANTGVSPYDLIVRYCEIDRIGMDENNLRKIAQQIKNNGAQ